MRQFTLTTFSNTLQRKIQFLLCLVAVFATFALQAQTVTQAWATLASTATSFHLSIDGAGNVYTANYPNTISKITPGGSITQAWATLASGANPRAIAIDADGNLYVANRSANTVSKITSGGSVTQTWATLASGANPCGIVLDTDGNVYTSNYTNSTVSKITAAGVVTQTWASLPSAGAFRIAIDASNNLYTANYDNNTVSKITPSGVVTAAWATLASNAYPWDIAVDASGNVYTANSGNNTVSRITSSGTVTQSWATLSSGSNPYGISVDASGNVYTANSGNSTVSRITSGGSVTQTWATLAPGSGVYQLAVAASGNVYTSNSSNKTVSRICITPTAYAVTGTGSYCTGGAGVAVGLANSETGVTYQLKNGASDVGSAVAGTGSAITFGNQTTAATYTVVATRTTGGCTATMTGNAVVTVTPNVGTPTFTAGATTLCTGATSTYTATASNSTSITYSILNGVGATINSSTGEVSAVTGNFTVVATAAGCGTSTTANRAVTVTSTTLYVDANVSASGDGSSWATAYASLADALTKAHQCSSVTRINVAAGTYKPTKKPFNSGTEMTTTDGRDLTFHIPSGVTIEGGYDASTGARDITVNVTTLSGDIGTVGSNTDNCYHVVLMPTASSNTTSMTKIDGFSITGGNANNSTLSSITVNGIAVARYYGGGILTYNGNNTFTNNTVYSNNSFSLGGGIFNFSGTNTFTDNTIYSNSGSSGSGIAISSGTNTLTNNTIYSNSISTSGEGGGINIFSGTNTLTNNTIYGNSGGSSSKGGGIFITSGTTTLTNNTLYSNSASDGGGVYINGGTNTYTNNILYSNSASDEGGGIYTNSGTNTLTNNTIYNNSGSYCGGIYTNSGTNTITNNIFWQNKLGTNASVTSADYRNSSATNTFKNNLLQLASSSYSSGNSNALGTSPSGNLFAQDPLFVSTTAPFDFNLQACSPVVNAGLNSAVSTIATDFVGATRVQQMTVDLGAYESSHVPITASITVTNNPGNSVLDLTTNGTSYAWSNMAATEDITVLTSGVYTVTVTNLDGCTATSSVTVGICPSSNTFHVNASVVGGAGDGSSWANAYASLGDALAKVHTTCSNVNIIKVAAGTYKPTKKPFNSGTEITTTDGRDLAFHIPDGVTIEGGYNASTGARDITANVTTLNGDIGTTGSNTDNCYHVVLVPTPSSNTTSITKIDGFSITGGNANTLSTFITVNGNDMYRSYGGGIYTRYGRATLTNNTLYSNSADWGGAIYISIGLSTIMNNTLYNNSASSYAGGIYVGSGTNTLANNTLYSNSAVFGGGGTYINLGTNTLINNIFWQNKKGTDASIVGADYISGSSTNTFKNNLLQLASSSYTSGSSNALAAGSSANIFNQNPLFVSTSPVNLNLQSTSPCINTGTATDAPTTDITGATRVGNPDMGAYEYLPPCTTPTAYAVTGTGAYCSGGAGVAVGLANSETGVTYQLMNGASTVGSAVAGTGSAITFGNQTTAVTYTVVATRTTGGCTATMTGSATVTVNTSPTASVSVIDNCGNSVLSATAGLASYVWSNAATTSSITVTNAANYVVTATAANGCTVTANGTSAPKTIPTASVSVIDNCGNSVLSTTAGLSSYLWSNNETTSSITVTNAANYIVTATAANGCTVTANGTSAPKTIPTANVSVIDNCGNSVLSATAGLASYLWSNTETTSSITVTNAANYVVTATAANGCTVTANGTSAPKTIPTASVSVIDNCGNSVLSATAGLTSYLWSNTETTSSITVTNAANYIVTATAANGCTVTANGTSAPKTIPTASVSVADNCGNSVLSATAGLASYVWSNAATTSSITVSNAANYIVTATAANGCTVTANGTSAPKTIPTASVSVIDNCGNSVLSVTSSPLGAGGYVWSNTETTSSITVTNAANYIVTATAANGCTVTANGTSAPKTIPTASVSVIDNCGNSVLDLTTNGTSFLWSNTATTEDITVSNAGSYTVTATNSNGCTVTSTASAAPISVPQMRAYLSGVSVTNNNDGIKDVGSFSVCSGVANISISKTFENLNSVGSPTQPVRVYQTQTSTNVSGMNWCNNCQALLTQFVSSTSTTATQINPSLPGTVVITFQAWYDANNNTIMDATECRGDVIEYTITINNTPLPLTFTNSNLCSDSGAGATITSTASVLGVNYQLYNSSNQTVGTVQSGTGSGLTWTNVPVGMGYYVIGTNTSNGCNSKSSTVTVAAGVSAYTVTGTGAYCSGGAGVAVGLANSETGVTYQLKNGASDVGSPVSGTGSAITFGNQTTAATYTVVATRTTGGCTATMTGSATVTVNTSPTASVSVIDNCGNSVLSATAGLASYLWSNNETTSSITVTNADNYIVTATAANGCTVTANGTSAPKTIPTASVSVIDNCGNSVLSVTSSPLGAGGYVWSNTETTSSITVTNAANYAVTVTAANGCTVTANGTAIPKTFPITYNVTGTGIYCTLGEVRLSNSEGGLSYQLKNGTTDVGSAVVGTGSAISFGNQPAGTYTAVATNTSTGCTATMTGNAVISLIGNTLHVNAAVSGGTGNGTSWANAYSSLSDALAVAHTCNAIKTIKVASGTYIPSKKPFENGVEMTTTDNRDMSFHVPDGVTIEGGYDASTGARDIVANVTTLSGEIGTAGISDNTYHVVLASASASSGLGVKVDGFSITGGSADGNGNLILNGNAIGKTVGGGIYTAHGMSVLSNNIIYNNTSSSGGSGILTFAGMNTISYNTVRDNEGNGMQIAYGMNMISHNRIYNNTAQLGAGIISFTAFNTITNNLIYNNTADEGGGIVNNSGTDIITNNTIYNNTAYSRGGGFSTSGNNIVANNIFWNNKQGSLTNIAGADYYVYNGNNTLNNNVLQLTSAAAYTLSGRNPMGAGSSNNIFAQDPQFTSTSIGSLDLSLQTSSPCVNAGTNGAGIPTIDFTGATRVGLPDIGAYEILCVPPVVYNVTGTATYCIGTTGAAVGLSNSEVGVMYQLKNGASNVGTAIAGTGAALSLGNQLAGTYTVVATRTSDGCVTNMSGNAVVTSMVCCPSGTTLYVNGSASAPTGGTSLAGTTWSNAYNSLSEALAMAHACNNIKSIKVASGTYIPSKKPFENGVEITTTDDRDKTFHVPDGVTIEGGYDASTGARDIVANVTTLSGEIGTAGNSDNTYHVVLASASASGGLGVKVDGFSITGGNADGNGNFTLNGNTVGKTYGGGIYALEGVNMLSNNIVFSNAASAGGGGIFTYSGNNTITYNTVRDNEAGGVEVDYGMNTISHNRIHNNTAEFGGGGILSYLSKSTITNNLIYNNTADDGGGIYQIFEQATITNNTIYNNTAYSIGGGLSTAGDNIVANNIFWNNKQDNATNVAGADFYIYYGDNTFNNNVLQLSSVSNYTLSGKNPMGTGSSNNLFAQDPQFTSTSVGSLDLSLQTSSPCVNAGTNGAGIPTIDFTGATRVGLPDIGAYEILCVPPVVYNVTGTATYCIGTTGAAVGLSNSEVGVMYQLKNGASNVGTAVAGTGAALSFGNQLAGTYTVVATRTSDGCVANMNVNAVVTSIVCCPSGTTLYVNGSASAPTGGTSLAGTTWSNAYNSLSEALAMAHACNNIKSIKVASGTYIPSKKPFENGVEITTTDDRDKTFHVPDGVTIEGGYDASTGARDIVANVTTLSGEIGTAGNSDNTYHVVLASASASGGLGVKVDGFSITGGNADGNGNLILNGNAIGKTVGGGIYTAHGMSMLSNNIIFNNAASAGGGGILTFAGMNSITYNTVRDNEGNGMQIAYGMNMISHNRIYNNAAELGGGIISFTAFNTITNNLIYNNTADEGGGIVNNSGTDIITNNTIYNNTAYSRGGGFSTSGNNIVANNIFWNNKQDNATNVAGADYYVYNGNNTLNNNVLQLTSAAAYTLSGRNPMGAGSSNNIFAQDPQFTSTSIGSLDLSLQTSSPCVNAGTNTLPSGGAGGGIPTIDFTGATRVGLPDIGAYEYFTPCTAPTAYAVNGSGIYCDGGPGVPIGLANSDIGVMYQLKNGASNVGAAVAGTGAALALGNQTITTTYTVVATRTSDGCTALMTGTAIIVPSGNTLYVNEAVAHNGLGISWATAYKSLSDALAAAHTCSNITTIKVATGTYMPTRKPFNSSVEITTTDNRDVAFHIPDGVTIEGGYNATTGARNATLNVTTLSGDIGTKNNDSDNAYHVILASAANSGGGGVMIDGFTIRDANANGTNSITVNGNTFERNSGGAIYTSFGTNKFSNNLIHSNLVSGNGAGICADNGLNTLLNNVIYNNTATTNGAAIYTNSGTNIITNNAMYNNIANANGAAIYTNNSTNTLVNNTIYNNAANTNGGGIYTNSGMNTLTNNIFWNNKQGVNTNVSGADYYNTSATNIFENNLLQIASSNYTFTGTGNYDLGTGANGNIFEQNPLFISTNPNTLSLRLRSISPCINAGTSTPPSGGAGGGIPSTDITGATRVGLPDIGAYENFISCPSVNTLYVNATVSGGAGDGTSWSNAYNNLSEALVIAHSCDNVTTIKVAAGTYKPTKKPFNGGIEITTTQARDVVFHIPDGVTIEGGYDAATGNRLPSFGGVGGGSILSGDIGTANVATDNCYRVVMASTTDSGVGVKIDGFTITGANANGSGALIVNTNSFSRGTGAGIFTRNGTNTITNNTIFGNAAVFGTGITVRSGTNIITNNTIYDNSVNNVAAAIYTLGGANTLTNNVMYNNTSSALAGAVYIYNGFNTLTNNTFYNNSAVFGGGALYMETGTTTLTNNIFRENKKAGLTNISGADFYNISGNNTFINNSLQLASSNYTSSGTDPYGLGTGASGNLFAQNPLFVSTSGTIDLRLQTCSPMINEGLNSAVSGIATDIVGATRTQQTVVDLGAYESPYVSPKIQAYTVTGSGNYCTGDAGLAVGLSNSETGVTYQLMNGTSTVGTSVAGTGAAISFGIQTVGTYTVVATKTNGGCTATMTGNAVLTSAVCCPSGNTLYVNAAASAPTGGNTLAGTSWSNAYNSLSEALAMAHSCSNVTTIKVAAGTYKPTKKPFNGGVEITTSNARDVVFHIPDGVTIEGGYDAATGNRLSSFGGVGGGSILSGDIGTANVATDNCYRVVVSAAPSSGGVGVKIDGFTITGGNANGSGTVLVNGTSFSRGTGGGLYVRNGMNTITNNIIYDNKAISGAGVVVRSSTNILENNAIYDNTSSNLAGGIYTFESNNTLTNNVMYNNTSATTGGAMYIYEGINTLTNNTFYNNAADEAGALYIEVSTTALTNNIFWENKKAGLTNVLGADFYNFDSDNTFVNNSMQLASSNYTSSGTDPYGLGTGASGNLFAQNPLFVSTSGTIDLRLQTCSPMINEGLNSAVSGIATDIAGATRTQQTVVDLGAYESPYVSPKIQAYTVTGSGNYCTGDAGLAVGLSNSETGVTYQLMNGTSTVGTSVAGTGAAISFGIQTVGTYTVIATKTNGGCTATMTGNAVLTSAVCCPSGNTLYVNVSASAPTGGNTLAGTSWSNAYNSLSEALAMAHSCSNVTTIKVASGTYKPTKKPFNGGVEITTTQARDVVFHIPDGVTIEGGYDANSGVRDITANVTTLSGDIGTANVATDNCYRVVMASATDSGLGIKIDGFTVTGANANGSGILIVNTNPFPRGTGAGIYTRNGTNTITNNKVFGNAANFGTGITVRSGTNIITNNTIYDNSVNNVAAAIYTLGGANTLTNNVMYNNTSSALAGAVYIYDGINTITNNTFYNNSAVFGGGAIYIETGITSLTNNIFSENKKAGIANISGADFFNSYGDNTFVNNLLQAASSNYTSTGTDAYGLGAGASGNLFEQNPLFVSTTGTIDLSLQPCSPLVNIGLNSAVSGIATDIAGSTRVQQTAVDLGAFESPYKTIQKFNVTGTGFYCAGSIGVVVGLSNSEIGITYQLKNGTTNVGTAIAGTGSAITFGNQTAATYTVVATDANGCTVMMTGNAVVTLYAVPTVSVAVTNNCGNSVLDLTTNGVSYLWSNATTTEDITVSNAGTYTVTITGANTCTATISETATPKIVPTASIAVTNNCGNSVLDLTTSSLGVSGSYAWSNATTTEDITVSNAGAYTVTVTATNACTVTATATAAPKVIPTVYNLTGNALYCGTGGTTINLSNSQIGVNYQLIKGSVNAGAARAGTGSALSWANQTAGTYTVVATNTAGACTATMSGTVTTTQKTIGIAVANISACNNNGTMGVSTDDYFTANVTVNFNYVPSGATLTLKRGTTTIATKTGLTTETSWTFTNVQMQSNGQSIVLTADLGDSCPFTSASLGTAPSSCSMIATLSGASLVCANAPANMVVNITGGVSPYTVVYNNGIADVTVSNYTSGSNITVMTATTRTYTLVAVKDANNDNGGVSGTATVTIDNVAPTFTNVPAELTVSQDSIPAFGAHSFTATDNAAGVVTISYLSQTQINLTKPNCYNTYYRLIRVYQATDACGNTATATQRILVADQVTMTCPSDKTFNTNNDGVNNYNCSTILRSSDNIAPLYSDLCNNSSLSYALSGATIANGSGSAAGLTFNIGVTQVRYTSTIPGSTIQRGCAFNVTILDKELPKITTVTQNVIDACDIPNPLPSSFNPTMTDNCSGALTLEVASDITANVTGCASKSATLKYTKSLIRTWKVTDASGNTATRTQIIYIRDMVAPTAVAKTLEVFVGNTNVNLLASAFNLSSSDNCTPSANLQYRACLGATCTTLNTSITLSKSHIPTGQNQVTLPVSFQVWDACSNKSTIVQTSITLKRATTMGAEQNGSLELPQVSDNDLVTPVETSTVDASHGSLKCYPNPFSEDLNLEFNLTQDVERLTLKVYDNQGRIVEQNERGEALAGYYQMRWNLSNLAAGLYHVCLELDGKCVRTERVIMMK